MDMYYSGERTVSGSTQNENVPFKGPWPEGVFSPLQK